MEPPQKLYKNDGHVFPRPLHTLGLLSTKTTLLYRKNYT